ILGGLTWLGCRWHGLDPGGPALAGVVTFLAAALLLNTRQARDAQEIVTDWAVRHGQRLVDLFPRLLRFVMEVSRWFLERIDRLLYSVDEWLRFRSGEGRLALVVKAVLGVVWFLATYLIRIYINLLVEPTVNPIKHFPVVTAAHKIMLPLIPT